ncbi:MAG: M6 family metalloprotease domain-containing protein [Planctomycetes bacterium]|nr:M6 family metalloprotease domain-containing protein [Planctomycetota bacterium]
MLTVLLFTAQGCFVGASPVDGQLFHWRQPDGSRIPVRIWGDEYYQIIESLDGYTLVRDPDTKYLSYARLSDDKRELVSIGVSASIGPAELGIDKHIRISDIARKAQIRAVRDEEAKRLPAVGLLAEPKANYSNPLSSSATMSTRQDIEGLCLLVDFPDEPATVEPNEIRDYCNLVGYSANGNRGSVRDYFYDVSGGKILYTNTVTESYYTAQYAKSYYDDPQAPYHAKARELILEALNALEESGFDFSRFDSDGDGLIDAINCMYAGPAGTTGLWPHSGTITIGLFTADGVSAHKYQISSIGSALTLGVFCHETGHTLFGWPDLYDYDYSSMGVGKYCLMGYGGQGANPVEPCAYLKYISGFSNTTTLQVYQAGLTATAGINQIYKFENETNPDEYFLVENRYRGNRDSNLPDSGLALWHIDAYGHNNLEYMTHSLHYKVALVQADGNFDLENDTNNGDAGDLWKSPDSTVCGPYYNTLQTRWWDGSQSELAIHDVSPAGETMTFSYRPDPLDIQPPEGLVSSGPEGGPFIPGSKTYTLLNSSNQTIEYQVSRNEDWFVLADNDGVESDVLQDSLGSFETTDIEVRLDKSAEALPEGFYVDTIIFTNLTSGLEMVRPITLDVHNLVMTLHETGFDEGLPGGWSIVDGNDDGYTWAPLNPSAPLYVSEYWTGPIMLVDGLFAGGRYLDEDLITPSMDCSNYDSVTLSFSHKLHIIQNETPAYVELSINSGPWRNLLSYDTSADGEVELPLPDADGRSDVRIRWHYVAMADRYWGIDNVKITGLCRGLSVSDLTRNCLVDMEDVSVFASYWLATDCQVFNAWCYGADMDRSCDVTMTDWAAFSRMDPSPE